MAEVAVSRQMFADILSLIARLRAPTSAGMMGASIKCSKRPRERHVLEVANERLSAFRRRQLPASIAVACAGRDLPLPSPAKGALLAGNCRKSGECRLK
jgi:hypothetical protein